MTGAAEPPRFWAVVPVLLLVAALLAGCTGKPDPECELLTWDGYEIEVIRIDGTKETRQVYPSEEGLDADGDEEDDCTESMNKTDPNDPDTSGNGLLDGHNVSMDNDDPRVSEWMDMGIAHTEEQGRIVFKGSFDHGVNPTKQDHAGSGIMDGEEVGGFSVWILGEERIVTTDPRTPDTSSDGLKDGFKRDAGLDPSTRDTDGDGVSDAEDVNPWIEFKVRLEVDSLNLTEDPFGRSQADLFFHLNIRDVQETPAGTVEVGETASGEPFSTSAMHPSNGGGDFKTGDHNLSFDLTVVTQSGGEQKRVDFFSQTTNAPSLAGAVHALTGDLAYGSKIDRQGWPSTATFEGEHGDITLRLVPVWPDPWQSCIDDGCRHGDGQFQWR